ncbi:amino acid adenylation domain-containing protein [Streptomyces armeniacus]|uniref:Amino acid adenylation domain-containing protein n=1 Tax=Streptomyces armeniacus TaxID=83291 RepID=A0A345XY24_9ACTN|nr:amino acid adenylation domain-containing protein [Streptomyces armeniacus]
MEGPEVSQPGGLEDILPLTPLQEGLLFHSVYDEDSLDVYTAQLVLDLEGPLDAERLRAAAHALLVRYPNLRAAFLHEGLSRPVQAVPADTAPTWHETDLRGAGPDAVRRVLEEERWTRFDVTRPPLLRFLLLRRGTEAYSLALTHHHILLDGWSMPVLLRDLWALYESGGRPHALAPAPRYKDHLAWLARQDKAAARAAWRTALADLDSPTLLRPGHRQGPAAPDKAECTVPAETSRRLVELSRARGLTLNTVFQSAWALVLGQLTGRDDVVFGVTVSGRPPELRGVDAMVGLFINTVPVRVRLAARTPAADALGGLQEEQARLLDHQWLGLADIQHAAGFQTLFDTAMVFENYPLEQAGQTGDEQREPRVTGVSGTDATHYPLSLAVVPGERFGLRLGYQPGLFAPHEAEAVVRRVVRVLESLAADPDRPLGQLDMLLDGERAQLLSAGADSAESYGGAEPYAGTQPFAGTRAEPRTERPSSAAELFEAQAARTPDAPAVTSGGTTLTYAALNARANALARRLRDLGVGPERLVAVALPRSEKLLTALLAVLKTGAGYLPVDPEYPAERIEFMLDDAAPGLIVTTSGTEADLPRTRVPSLLLDGDETALPAGAAAANLRDGDRLAPADPAHPAYVIYTSGTTGRPKGVVIEQGGLGRYLRWMRDGHPAAAGTALLHSAVSFDLTVTALYAPLVSGGCVRADDLDEHAVPGEGRPRTTLMKVTPSHLPLLDDLPAEVSPADCLVVAGEQLTGEALAAWRRRHPHAAVVNSYGPTETTVNCAEFRLEPGESAPEGPLPVGRPVGGMRLYVLDGALRPVPAGARGELYVAGPGLARGYLNRPAPTGERFVSDPYGPPGARMYRTGDLARWRGDGLLEFFGRADDQVKVRGFRIEPGEIESVLTGSPGVERCAVVVREDHPGDRRLVAYLAAQDGDADVAQARAHLAARVPEYMVPSAFVVLERLPLTPNGKVDRRALPRPEYGSGSVGRGPRGPREEILCELFAEALGATAVGIDDDFFASGGHSLLATRLVGRIRSTLGVGLAVRRLFEHPTVAALAAALEDTEGRADGADGADGAAGVRPDLAPAVRPERVPVSFAQQRLWFLHQLEGPSATYNMPLALRLSGGGLDVAALRAAVDDLVVRHESLRTVFSEDESGTYQHVLAPGDTGTALTVTRCDADRLDAELAAAAAYAFDLAAEVPFRAVLFEASAQEHVLLLLVHHIAADGWSAGSLLRDLAAAYTARRDGGSPAWPALPVQYADHALWQRRMLSGDDTEGALSRQLAYWRDALRELPEEISLPLDRPRPAKATHRGDRTEFTITPDLHQRLATTARAAHTSVFMVLQTGLAILLHRLGAGTDIPLGAPIAGRTEAAAENVVGLFANTLVLRTDLSGDPTVRELLSRVRDTDLGAYAHQDVPFERLVEEVNPARSLSRHPLFQVMLAFNNTGAQTASGDLPDFPGTAVTAQHVDSGVARFDLAFALAEPGSDGGESAGLRGVLEFATDLFDAETAEWLVAAYVRVLESVARDQAQRVGAVDVLATGERHRLLEEFNDAERAFPTGTVVELFEEQALRAPEATAVVCGGRVLSYAEVDARAGRLAWLLAGRGVGPESLVAVAVVYYFCRYTGAHREIVLSVRRRRRLCIGGRGEAGPLVARRPQFGGERPEGLLHAAAVVDVLDAARVQRRVQLLEVRGHGRARDGRADDAGDQRGLYLGVPRGAVDRRDGLLRLADLEPVPQPHHPLGGPYGHHVGRRDEQRAVGHLDRGGVRGVHLGAAVDDDDLVARAHGADDLARGAVVDLLAAFALGGREEQREAGLVREHSVLEHARRQIADPGQVGGRAPELDVQERRDVPGLQVQVDERGVAPGRAGGQGQFHGGERAADAALGARHRDDRAARPAERLGPGAQVAAYARRPRGGRADPRHQLVVRQRQPDHPARARVHGRGVQARGRVPGDQDDRHGREAEGDLADQLQRGQRADQLVYEHGLGQVGDGLGRGLREGVEELRGVDRGRLRFAVGQLVEERDQGARGVRVADCREDAGDHGAHLFPARVYVRSSSGMGSLPGATSARRTCSANDSAYATRWASAVERANVIGTPSRSRSRVRASSSSLSLNGVSSPTSMTSALLTITLDWEGWALPPAPPVRSPSKVA